VNVSQLCKMIEDSIHGGKYPLQNEHKPYYNLLQVINRSDSDDLKSSEIKIEVRMRRLYIISNYVPNIRHLPGIIEGDVLDYFKILRLIFVPSSLPGWLRLRLPSIPPFPLTH
jgi:hypothetical protein